MNLSPKERCLNNQTFVQIHNNLVDSPNFQHACDMAMLQLVNLLSTGYSCSSSEAMAAGYRLDGAKLFLRTIMELTHKPELKSTNSRGIIDYSA